MTIETLMNLPQTNMQLFNDVRPLWGGKSLSRIACQAIENFSQSYFGQKCGALEQSEFRELAR